MSRLVIIVGIFLIANIINAQTQEKQSIAEFSNGNTIKYSSNGTGKSLGLKLHIKYPSSWKSVEGEHPHVVRKFVQPDNAAALIVLVNKLDNPLTITEINEFLSPEGLKPIIPVGSNVISIETKLRIEGLKAGCIDFSSSAVRMNRIFNSYNRFYVFVYKDYLIMIQFMVVNKIDESNQSVMMRYDILKPLFYQIFNSIVIDNIWQ